MAYETVGHETLAYARRFLLAERLRHERALVVEEQRQVLTAAAIGETREHLASIEAALALLPQEPAAKAAEAETPLAPGDVVAEAPAAPEAEPEAPPVLTLVSPATLGLGAAPEAAPSLEDAAPEPPELGAIQPPEDAEEERPFWATAGAVE